MHTDADPTSATTALADARRAFQDGVARRDVGTMAAAYAPDARLILPSGAAVDGRDAIEMFWQTGFDAGTSGMDLQEISVVIGVGVAWETGEYRLRAEPLDERPAAEDGRYLVVHRLGADGRWRRAVDLLVPAGDVTVESGGLIVAVADGRRSCAGTRAPSSASAD